MLFEILLDAGETPNKCTIAPLAARADFRLFPVQGEGKIGPLTAPVLLHHEGACLTEVRQRVTNPPAIAAIDCVWRRVPRLLQRIEWTNGNPPIQAKIPMGFQTVYPRVGFSSAEPSNGLATIEALFVAGALLGRYDLTLLEKYPFAARFLIANAPLFRTLGIRDLSDPDALPPFPPIDRNALSRRINRGRAAKHLYPLPKAR